MKKFQIFLCTLITILVTVNEIHTQIINPSAQRYNRNGNRDFIYPPPDFPAELNVDRGDEDDKKSKDSSVKGEGSVIPLELIEKINNVENITQFLNEIVSQDTIDSREIIASRFGDETIERSVGIIPKAAVCMPENTVVPLEPINMSKDSTIVYYPSCTRVKRCGGCCTSSLYSCQPLETETLTYSVYKVQYRGGSKMDYQGKEIVLVDQHLKCACSCRVKATDCNNYQTYDRSQCKCSCTNYDEKQKCLQQHNKIWDDENCICRCREIVQCSLNTYFDERQCLCTEAPFFRADDRTTSFFDRRKFIIKPVPVNPDNNTKYDTEV